jgi:hypothetical protein
MLSIEIYLKVHTFVPVEVKESDVIKHIKSNKLHLFIDK